MGRAELDALVDDPVPAGDEHWIGELERHELERALLALWSEEDAVEAPRGDEGPVLRGRDVGEARREHGEQRLDLDPTQVVHVHRGADAYVLDTVHDLALPLERRANDARHIGRTAVVVAGHDEPVEPTSPCAFWVVRGRCGHAGEVAPDRLDGRRRAERRERCGGLGGGVFGLALGEHLDTETFDHVLDAELGRGL